MKVYSCGNILSLLTIHIGYPMRHLKKSALSSAAIIVLGTTTPALATTSLEECIFNVLETQSGFMPVQTNLPDGKTKFTIGSCNMETGLCSTTSVVTQNGSTEITIEATENVPLAGHPVKGGASASVTYNVGEAPSYPTIKKNTFELITPATTGQEKEAVSKAIRDDYVDVNNCEVRAKATFTVPRR
jgi:hypothetical protein